MSHNLSLVRQAGPSSEPQRFGVYEVEAVLGEGTMGRVYRGRHQTLGRKVAIKSLHPQLISDPGLVTRFLQEARLVNTINHPHIVEVYDFVEAPGQVYAVMELLEGETLTQRLAREPMSLEHTVRIATQVAEALLASHALSVVHRDLKPDNVFLAQRDGIDWVKVLDFGVAKLLVQDGPRVVETQNGDVLGTPRYMAPEQAAGLEVDARTDVYAWGTLLFEMLAARPPFEATVYGQLAADIITRPPPPVPEVTRTGEPVPEALRRLVAGCLAKMPDQRPRSMEVLLQRLQHLDEPIDEVTPLPVRRRGGTWVFVGAAAVTVSAIAAVVSMSQAQGPGRASAPPPPAQLEQPAPPAPPVEPARVEEVSLDLQTAPPGARVTSADGAVLGTTPLTVKRSRSDDALTLQFELQGFEPASRAFPLSSSVIVELPLKRLAAPPQKKPPSKPVTDGVLDPF